MSHRVHPKVFRIKDIDDWTSQWFNKRKYRDYLEQDYNIRDFIKEQLKQAAIDEVTIKRSANSIQIIIKAGRPGIIIGRGGTGIQDLKRELIRKIFSAKGGSASGGKGKIKSLDIKIDVEEIPKSETQAAIVARGVVEQLERRMPFRRVLKQTIEKVMQNPEVKGVKIRVSGRLNGAEMARDGQLMRGRLPLQTIRANINYVQTSAYTVYGVIGVKVWIYKGEVFE
jgi:small subunit ribosomal protein S3